MVKKMVQNNIRSFTLLPILILTLITSGAVLALSYFNINININIANSLISKDNQTSISSSVSAQTTECTASDTSNWCQVQHDPQRTGYTPEVLGTNFKVAWTYPFQPDKVYPQVQAIIYRGKVFVGTEGANGQTASIYALNSQTGQLVWKYPVGSPILASVAASNGRIFFGANNGTVYALDSQAGSLLWKTDFLGGLGFSSAPVLAENKVMLGSRNGIFYALDVSTGQLLWQHNVGAPILQTASYNNGRVFFGAMDMYIYALNTSNGSLAWKSQKVNSMAFKDYWPVVYDNKVLIRPMGHGYIQPGHPFGYFIYGSISNPGWDWLLQNGSLVAEGKLSELADAMTAQDTIMADYEANTANYTKSLYVLDEGTGLESTVAPHGNGQTMHGATSPPCIDRDGYLIIPIHFVASGWGRLNLNYLSPQYNEVKPRIVDILYDHTNKKGGSINPQGSTDDKLPAGMGNRDETLNATCANNMIFAMHTQEGNANYTGAFDLNNRKWIRIGSGYTNRQMSTNTQGGGGNPASIANGIIYHISWHELIARKAQ